jgi:uncharacterized membrane protein required for colicin V production
MAARSAGVIPVNVLFCPLQHVTDVEASSVVNVVYGLLKYIHVAGLGSVVQAIGLFFGYNESLVGGHYRQAPLVGWGG